MHYLTCQSSILGSLGCSRLPIDTPKAFRYLEAQWNDAGWIEMPQRVRWPATGFGRMTP